MKAKINETKERLTAPMVDFLNSKKEDKLERLKENLNTQKNEIIIPEFVVKAIAYPAAAVSIAVDKFFK